MVKDTDQMVLFEGYPGTNPETRTPLVHVLTPEFQGIDKAEFADINPEQLKTVSPETLRMSLLDTNNDGRSTISYHAPEPDHRWIRISVTPKEFGLFSRHVDMLAKTAFNGVLVQRDEKLKKETGNPTAKARTDDDIDAANRASVRQVRSKKQKMEEYLVSDILPRLEIIEKFKEMAKNRNLARGTRESVKERFEKLRTYVFDDMLDAICNHKGLDAEQTKLVKRSLQKLLYLESDPDKRTTNFSDLLSLSEEYYGRKRALILGRIAESQRYFRKNPKAVADVEAKDKERSEEQHI